MAKIKTRKSVDLQAVDRRLVQMGLPSGLVSRHDTVAGEWEIETADPTVADADLARVLADVPEAQLHDDSAVRAERKAKVQELVGKATWKPADTEAALRLLLTAELERS